MTTGEWWGPMNNWLIGKANAHFHEWAESKAGANWRKGLNRNKSPYRFGYSQPEWMREMVEALGHNDEQTCKRLKLENL